MLCVLRAGTASRACAGTTSTTCCPSPAWRCCCRRAGWAAVRRSPGAWTLPPLLALPWGLWLVAWLPSLGASTLRASLLGPSVGQEPPFLLMLSNVPHSAPAVHPRRHRRSGARVPRRAALQAGRGAVHAGTAGSGAADPAGSGTGAGWPRACGARCGAGRRTGRRGRGRRRWGRRCCCGGGRGGRSSCGWSGGNGGGSGADAV